MESGHQSDIFETTCNKVHTLRNGVSVSVKLLYTSYPGYFIAQFSFLFLPCWYMRLFEIIVTQHHKMRLFEGIVKIEKKVLHCNKHYFLHSLKQIWLLCDIPIKIYDVLNITKYDVIQNNFTEIWTVKDCNMCVLLSVDREENVQ